MIIISVYLWGAKARKPESHLQTNNFIYNGMIVDAKKLARGAGRFLTKRAEIGAGRLAYAANKYREFDDASGGVVSTVLSATPIPQMVSTIYNPLAGSINAMNALGKGLTTIGNLDYKKINYKAAGQGIQDLKQAYDFGSALFK